MKIYKRRHIWVDAENRVKWRILWRISIWEYITYDSCTTISIIRNLSSFKLVKNQFLVLCRLEDIQGIFYQIVFHHTIHKELMCKFLKLVQTAKSTWYLCCAQLWTSCSFLQNGRLPEVKEPYNDEQLTLDNTIIFINIFSSPTLQSKGRILCLKQ